MSRTAPARSMSAFDVGVRRERRSLLRALARIDRAELDRRHAFVFIATIFGHYPWLAQRGAERQPSRAKLAAITKAIDGLLGEFSDSLQRRGLGDSTIIVVTGDHGLRSRSEFASLDEDMRFGTVSFNVPMMIAAPGVLDREVHLPYATSHVDFAPTLFYLLGVPDTSLLLHGSSMLDPALRTRATFMLNNQLRPVNGYHQHDSLFVYNSFTGLGEVSAAWRSAPSARTPISVEATRRIRLRLARAAALFDTTAAALLQRASPSKR